MTKNPLIKYYEVLKSTVIYRLDDMNRTAFPEKSESKKIWKVAVGRYVKSFGQVGKYKTPDGKLELLVMVDGHGVNMADLRLYADEVDDCGCDGNPVATPTDLEKLNAAVNESEKESSFSDTPKKRSKIDKWAVVGFLALAAIASGAVWYKTKDKKKTIIAGVIGGVVGMIIGYFVGKRGESKEATVDSVDDIEMESEVESVPEVTDSKAEDKADKKEFLQLGQTYEFTLPFQMYAMIYGNGAFYIAKDKNGNRIKLSKDQLLKGKLLEVADPQIFIASQKSNKVERIKSKKPLPFLDLGNKLYIPLSVVDSDSMIDTQEAMDYLDGSRSLDQEVYIKGRYAGKRLFNLMYMPTHETVIRERFGKRVK